MSVLVLDCGPYRMPCRNPPKIGRVQIPHRNGSTVDDYAVLPDLNGLPGQPHDSFEESKPQPRIVGNMQQNEVSALWQSSGDATLRIWDLEIGVCPMRLDGPATWWFRLLCRVFNTGQLPGRILSVCISRDGRRAISEGGDGRLRLWDLEKGEVLTYFEGSRKLGGFRGPCTRRPARRIRRLPRHSAGMGLGDRQNHHTLKGHTGSVNATSITADGRGIDNSGDLVSGNDTGFLASGPLWLENRYGIGRKPGL